MLKQPIEISSLHLISIFLKGVTDWEGWLNWECSIIKQSYYFLKLSLYVVFAVRFKEIYGQR